MKFKLILKELFLEPHCPFLQDKRLKQLPGPAVLTPGAALSRGRRSVLKGLTQIVRALALSRVLRCTTS